MFPALVLRFIVPPWESPIGRPASPSLLSANLVQCEGVPREDRIHLERLLASRSQAT
jgi:hypothetical protein